MTNGSSEKKESKQYTLKVICIQTRFFACHQQDSQFVFEACLGWLKIPAAAHVSMDSSD